MIVLRKNRIPMRRNVGMPLMSELLYLSLSFCSAASCKTNKLLRDTVYTWVCKSCCSFPFSRFSCSQVTLFAYEHWWRWDDYWEHTQAHLMCWSTHAKNTTRVQSLLRFTHVSLPLTHSHFLSDIARSLSCTSYVYMLSIDVSVVVGGRSALLYFIRTPSLVSLTY